MANHKAAAGHGIGQIIFLFWIGQAKDFPQKMTPIKNIFHISMTQNNL